MNLKYYTARDDEDFQKTDEYQHETNSYENSWRQAWKIHDECSKKAGHEASLLKIVDYWKYIL